MNFQHTPDRPMPGKDSVLSHVLAEGQIRETRRRRRNIGIGIVAAVTTFAAGVGLGYLRPWVNQTAEPATSPSLPVATPSGSSSPDPSATPTAIIQTNAPWQKVKIVLGTGGGFSLNGVSSDKEGTAEWAIKLLGEPSERIPQTTCGTEKVKTTALRWGDLKLVVLDEPVGGEYGASWTVGKINGWSLDPRYDGQPGLSLDARFGNGIGIGSTLTKAWEAFANEDDRYRIPKGNVFTVFSGDTTGASMSLDAADKIRAMNSGYACVSPLKGTLGELPKIKVGGVDKGIQAFADDLAAGNWDDIADKCWQIAPQRLAGLADPDIRKKMLSLMQGKLQEGQHVRDYQEPGGWPRAVFPQKGSEYSCGYFLSSESEAKAHNGKDAQWRILVLHELLNLGQDTSAFVSIDPVVNANLGKSGITEAGAALINELAQSPATNAKVVGSCRVEVRPGGKSGPIAAFEPCAGGSLIELRGR